jgi:hypothetical protein
MQTRVQVILKWYDERIFWDPNEYKNQTRLVVSSNEIWTPGEILIIILKTRGFS